MNSELCPTAFEHLIKHMDVSVANPGVLMDNHQSHISVEVVEMARENGLSIGSFAPHCSHKMQSLDVCVYGPFKRHFNVACDSWMLSQSRQFRSMMWQNLVNKHSVKPFHSQTSHRPLKQQGYIHSIGRYSQKTRSCRQQLQIGLVLMDTPQSHQKPHHISVKHTHHLRVKHTHTIYESNTHTQSTSQAPTPSTSQAPTTYASQAPTPSANQAPTPSHTVESPTNHGSSQSSKSTTPE